MPTFQGKLYFATYQNTKRFEALAFGTIVRAIRTHARGPYEATILIDGLHRKKRRKVGAFLRQSGLRLRKVRGVRDEYDTLTRLSDAVCGLVGAAQGGEKAARELFEQGSKTGHLKKV